MAIAMAVAMATFAMATVAMAVAVATVGWGAPPKKRTMFACRLNIGRHAVHDFGTEQCCCCRRPASM